MSTCCVTVVSVAHTRTVKKLAAVVTIGLVLAGSYAVADAWDVVPGPLTTRPLPPSPRPEPTIAPLKKPTLASFDFSTTAPLPDPTLAQEAAQKFASDPELHGAVSLLVTDALTGSVIASLGPDTPALPASTMKVMTAAAALHEFGPSKRLETKATLDGSTLYIVGGGDTFIGVDKRVPGNIRGRALLTDLANQIAANPKVPKTGLTLDVDSSLFGPPLYHPEIIGTDREYVMEMRPLAIIRGVIDGKFAPDPDLHLIEKLKDLLAERGVTVTLGGRATSPATAVEVGHIESAPMSEIVDEMLTNSDNSIAEILGHLMAIKRGLPATFEGAASAVTTILREMGVPMDGVVISDNSGLSILDRLTPKALVSILRMMATCESNCHWGSLGMGLPVGGLTGTLSKRFDGTDLKGWVRAKTGTLIMSSTLAGYMTTEAGRVLTFAIMVHDIQPGYTQTARPRMDAFLTTLAKMKGVPAGR